MALDREVVVRTSLRLLDEVGLEGFTLRRLASELSVQAPALYWHFKSKQALLDAMAATVFADAFAAFDFPQDGADWEGFARDYARALRAMLLRYRDGARVFSGTHLADGDLYGAMEQAIAVFVSAGFIPRDAARFLSTLYSYTVGFAIEEQAVHPRPGEVDTRYLPQQRAKRLDSQDLPFLVELGDDPVANFEERFHFGLVLIVAGMGMRR